MSLYRQNDLLDKLFKGGIILKGLSGLSELVAGVLLLFISPQRMHGFINLITQKELAEDPGDKLAVFLINATNNFGNGSRVFLIIYLWIHAGIKLIVVIGILKNKLWAYPFSLISLGLLTLYQLYSIVFVKVSIGIIFLTVFDALILCLIWREYRKMSELRSNLKN